MLAFERQTELRKSLRLRCWKGLRGELLAGDSSHGQLSSGEYYSLLDLGRHYWVISVECDFSVAGAGGYRLEYVCDPEGQFAAVDDIAEIAWLRIAAGSATQGNQFVRKSSPLGEVIDDAGSHAQPALFMRYLRVVFDSANAEVSAWRVYEDSYIDLSDRIVGSLSWTRDSDDRAAGRSLRPTMSVQLADDDGALAVRSSGAPAIADYFDENGLTYLRRNSRWTLEISYRGPSWELPEGFEGTSWWPVYCGYRTMRQRKRVEGQPTTVSYSFRSGIKALNGTTEPPLFERMDPIEFLTKYLTMSDDGQTRLMGAGSSLPMPIQVVKNEIVGSTQMFAGNWFGELGKVDEAEQILGLMDTGHDLIAVIFERVVEENADESYFVNLKSKWWFVRYDYTMAEIERWEIVDHLSNPNQHSGRRSGDPGGIPVKFGRGANFISGAALAGDYVVLGIASIDDFDQDGNPQSGYRSWGFVRKLAAELDNIDTEGERISVGANEGDVLIGAVVGIPNGPLAGGFVAQVQTVFHFDENNAHHFRFYDADGAYVGRWPDQDIWGRVHRFGTSRAAGDRFLMILSGVQDQEWSDDIAGTDGSVRIWEIEVTSASPFAVEVVENGFRATSWRFSALASTESFILAGGIGPDGYQAVARVARFGYPLENSELLSRAAGDRTVGFAEPQVLSAGQILAAGYDYELDRAAGRLTLNRMRPDREQLTANYDYRPVFGLVKIEGKRWEIAQEVAAAFGLALSVDAFDRLFVEPRVFEEFILFVKTGADHILGSSVDPAGLAHIVPESIEVLDASTLLPLDESLYNVTTIEGVKAGDPYTRYRVILYAGEVKLQRDAIARFVVQRNIETVDALHLSEGDSDEGEEVITKIRVEGKRRVPTDFARRIVQILAVAPSDAVVASGFDRLQPLEGVRRYDWQPQDALFEDVDPDEEKPVAHVIFDQPLLLGSSEFEIEQGKHPVYYANDLFWNSGVGFLEISFAPDSQPPDANYVVAVWPESEWRLATAEDYADMIAANMGPGSSVPSSADDVKTVSHFYVKRMNPEGDGIVYVMAYDTEVVTYAKDAQGKVYVNTGSGDEQFFKTAYPDHRVRVRVTPHDVNGVPLLPTWNLEADSLFPHEDRILAIDDVQVTPKGVTVSVRTSARGQNFVTVEVVGYPVLEAETVFGDARSTVGIDLYGEQEKQYANRFLINRAFAKRAARLLMEGRDIEPVNYDLELTLSAMVGERELVRTVDESGAVVLRRVRRVTHTVSPDGSRSEYRLVEG